MAKVIKVNIAVTYHPTKRAHKAEKLTTNLSINIVTPMKSFVIQALEATQNAI